MDKPIRPAMVSDEQLEYLDELRESGAVNMFGAALNLREEFTELGRGDSVKVLGYWMVTYGGER